MSEIYTQHLAFDGSQGYRLDARLDMPGAEPVAYALFAHCFTCSKETLAASRVCRALAERGIGVLRFDFTGLGDSQGDFAATDFSSNIADLVCAADYLRAEHAAPEILIGHSLGGPAAIVAAGRIPESTAVVTIAAPSEPAHIQTHFADAVARIERFGEAEVAIDGRSFRIRKPFLEDLDDYDMTSYLHALNRALLIFHSPRDTVVDIDNAQAIFMAAMHPKSFISLDHADHLLTGREDADYVADVLSAWAMRFI